jgi:hypothetical protein
MVRLTPLTVTEPLIAMYFANGCGAQPVCQTQRLLQINRHAYGIQPFGAIQCFSRHVDGKAVDGMRDNRQANPVHCDAVAMMYVPQIQRIGRNNQTQPAGAVAGFSNVPHIRNEPTKHLPPSP